MFSVIRDYYPLDNVYKNAAAGAFAGGVSVMLFQGIDVVKVSSIWCCCWWCWWCWCSGGRQSLPAASCIGF